MINFYSGNSEYILRYENNLYPPLTKSSPINNWNLTFGNNQNKSIFQLKEKPTHEELFDLLYYKLSGYRCINPYLNGITNYPGKNPASKIKNIDKIMKSSTVARDLIVYRGLKAELSREFKIGKIYEEKGYVSTSMSFDAAKVKAEPYILKINLPKGSNAIDINSLLTPSYLKKDSQILIDEQEILLPRNSKFQVVDINTDTHIIEANLLSTL